MSAIKSIHEGQKARVNGYQQALREIRSGRKTGHWIWYIWPSLKEVRKTSRPQRHGEISESFQSLFSFCSLARLV